MVYAILLFVAPDRDVDHNDALNLMYEIIIYNLLLEGFNVNGKDPLLSDWSYRSPLSAPIQNHPPIPILFLFNPSKLHIAPMQIIPMVDEWDRNGSDRKGSEWNGAPFH